MVRGSELWLRTPSDSESSLRHEAEGEAMTTEEPARHRPCCEKPRQEWKGKRLIGDRGESLCIYCGKPAQYIGAGVPHWTLPRIEDNGKQRTIHFENVFAHHDCIAKEWVKAELRNPYRAAETRRWLLARLAATKPSREAVSDFPPSKYKFDPEPIKEALR
jgi:hypothetical protein